MKVLAAVEGAEGLQAITARLVDQSKPGDTDVHLLHVVDPFPVSKAERLGTKERPDFEAARREQRETATALLQHASAVLRGAGLGVSFSVEEGDVTATILDQAHRLAADLIVIGTHARSGISRLLHRSVANAVANAASCAVEIIPMSVRQDSSRGRSVR